MGEPQHNAGFDELSIGEQILHVQDLWERIAEEPSRVPVSDVQQEELDKRLREHRENPGAVVAWEVLKARLQEKV